MSDMLPDWEAIRSTWPLLIGGAVVWARLEVALALARAQSKTNELEIHKLEAKVEAQASAAQGQAVQLGRIESSIDGIRSMLELLIKDRPPSG